MAFSASPTSIADWSGSSQGRGMQQPQQTLSLSAPSARNSRLHCTQRRDGPTAPGYQRALRGAERRSVH